MSHFRGSTGTLIIVVKRARDLPNKRKLEKQNPYCLLRVANLTDKTNADMRGGQVPRWDAEFRFHISPEMSPVLKMSVLDETKKAPTLIAEADVDITPVFYASVKDGFDKWHPLYSGDGREAGEVYLEMTFYPAGGSTTFSSSGRKLGSSYGSNASSTSSASRQRQLPPPPGQEHVPMAPVVDENAIPAPLPRAREASPMVELPRVSELQFRESMSKSMMSIHSLSDLPQRVSPPLRDFPEYSYDAVNEDSRISSSNAFDELEREVQLNYDGAQPKQRRSKVPPPVPSHSSGSLKDSYTSLAPPRASLPSLSSTVYDIIEPQQHHEQPRRQSPTRKPPMNFYKSGNTSPKRLDLSSIPYDAGAIGRGLSPTRDTHGDSDVLLEKHNAPTPYEAFVQQAGSSTGSNSSMNSSGRSRMSPSRFRSSLPP